MSNTGPEGEDKTVPTPKNSAPADLEPQSTQAAPAEVLKVLEKLPQRELVSLFAQSTTRFGPDPETAKILVQAEQHEEDCRLEAYKASLVNKEQESSRDHDFRVLRLNREFWMSIVVLLGAMSLCGVGVYLIVAGQNTLGSNLLIAGGGVLLYVLKGNSSFLGKD